MTRHPERHQAWRRARLVAALLVALVGFFAAQGAAADAAQMRAVTIDVDDGRFTELKPVVVSSSTARLRDGSGTPARPDVGDPVVPVLVAELSLPERSACEPVRFAMAPSALGCGEAVLRAPGVERGPPGPSLP